MTKRDLSNFESRYNDESGEQEYYYEPDDEWLEEDDFIEILEENDYWEEWSNDINNQHGGLDWKD